MLIGIHFSLAALTNRDEWQLEKDEAKAFANSIENVARHYPQIAGSQKMVDWLLLLQVIGMTYGTRIAAISMAKKAEQNAKKGNNNVVSLAPSIPM